MTIVTTGKGEGKWVGKKSDKYHNTSKVDVGKTSRVCS